jgi:hypothetical protein
MPESPINLVSKSKKIETEKSLIWLRDARYITDYDLKHELERMQNFFSQSKRESPTEETSSTDITVHIVFFMKEIPQLLFTLSPSPTKISVNIVCWLMTFRQVNGINAVIFYAVDIFQMAGGILSSFMSTFIVGIVQFVAACLSSLFVERT